MGSEPLVYTDDVKAVAALRELADLVADGELGETDGTVGELGGGIGGEGELGEGAQDFLLDALVGPRERRTGQGVRVGGRSDGREAAEPSASSYGDKTQDAD